ncbi:RagB/SusD family nutrient uptake outer membrane protein [Pedobacter sp. WC2423]|uniref:RagB/SusD family nutrient uptake outer membrane protein n=1 Tax=Pedobacter sp. WC2423 TaxID=3234142 RepID=UPI003465A7B5
MNRKNIFLTLFILICVCSISCKKDFLDVRPNSKEVKFSAADCQALLDNFDVMNALYPIDGELSSDNYYLLTSTYNGLFDQADKDIHRWASDARRNGANSSWIAPYTVVYNANLVIKVLQDDPGNLNQITINTLRGSALFFRAHAFFQVAQLYAKPYDQNSTNSDPGIPVRTEPDLEVESERGTVKQTYDRIIQDFKEAITLLPLTSSIKSRPNRVAAFAALARTFLAMEDYNNAGIYADSCLKYHKTLLDYNSISRTSLTPFTRFNDEVIFHSTTNAAGPVRPSIALIDTLLYRSYNDHDLRKEIFFNPVAAGQRFTGNYNPVTIAAFFNGFATDEVYLIRAECYARNGKIDLAMADLNTLMKTRWDDNVVYPTIGATTVDEALSKVIEERRKELLFRGLRWSDLRRLNKDTKFQKTLYRNLDGTTYSLPPNDKRYVLLIDQQVINNSNLQQNPR